MPNHVTNRLIVEGDPEKVERFFAAVNSETEKDYPFDFSRIIPVPPDIFQGSLTMEEQEKTKGRNWYDWNRTNWGTKWNAYDAVRKNNVIYFDTAWSAPMPVMEKIATDYPEITIHYAYADEDIGHNLGFGLIEGGKIEMIHPQPGKEANKLAKEIKSRKMLKGKKRKK